MADMRLLAELIGPAQPLQDAAGAAHPFQTMIPRPVPIDRLDLFQLGPQVYSQRSGVPLDAIYSQYPEFRPLSSGETRPAKSADPGPGPVQRIQESRQALLDALSPQP